MFLKAFVFLVLVFIWYWQKKAKRFSSGISCSCFDDEYRHIVSYPTPLLLLEKECFEVLTVSRIGIFSKKQNTKYMNITDKQCSKTSTIRKSIYLVVYLGALEDDGYYLRHADE